MEQSTTKKIMIDSVLKQSIPSAILCIGLLSSIVRTTGQKILLAPDVTEW